MYHKFNLEYDKIILLSLIVDVENMSEMRKNIMRANIQCGIIKASLIVDPFQVVVAANKAVVSDLFGKKTTKNLYTEVLYNLSLTNNITQSLLKFGINDLEKNIIIMVIGEETEYTYATMANTLMSIKGEERDLSELDGFTNKEEVKNEYTIHEDELSVSSLVNSVVSRIATKTVLIH